MVLVPAHAARGSLRLQGVRFDEGRPRALDRSHRVRGSDDATACAAAREHRNPHARVFLTSVIPEPSQRVRPEVAGPMTGSARRPESITIALAEAAPRLSRNDGGYGFRTCRCAAIRNDGYYRFENWKLRRALALPYFLRSTTRGSRVTKPPRLSTLRSSGSCLISALDMPWRTAPAWPDNPPPDTVQTTSYWPWRFAATSGCWISMRSTGRAK